MGLLDGIESVRGAPKANYLKGGRTLLEITRVSFTEDNPNEDIKASFRVDGKVLHSTNPEGNQVGMVKTIVVNFKYPKTSRPNMARIMCAIASSKFGKTFEQKDLTKEKFLELTGTSQPLVGAIIAVDAIEDRKESRVSEKNPEGLFTSYEAYVPGEADLKAFEAA